jgi:hypothetical protein
LRRISALARLGRPILIGASRKSFLGAALDLPVEERLEASLAVAALAAAHGATSCASTTCGPPCASCGWSTRSAGPEARMVERLYAALHVQDLGLWAALDILLLAAIIYQLLLLLRGTRSVNVLLALATLALFYVATAPGLIELRAVHTILGNLLLYIPLLVIVVFQNQIRRPWPSSGATRSARSCPSRDREPDRGGGAGQRLARQQAHGRADRDRARRRPAHVRRDRDRARRARVLRPAAEPVSRRARRSTTAP